MIKTMYKRILYILFSTILVVALPACLQYYDDTHRLAYGGITYYEFFGIDIDSKYHRAYDNCRWIREVEPQLDVNRRGIDDTEVSAATLTEEEKASVRLIGNESEEEFKNSDTEYWAFTVGTPKNNYVMVCNSETNEVVGVITSGDGWKEEPWGIELAREVGIADDQLHSFCHCIDTIDRHPEFKVLGIDETKVSIDRLTEDEKSQVILLDKTYKTEFDETQAENYDVYTIGEPENCCKLVCYHDSWSGALGMLP